MVLTIGTVIGLLLVSQYGIALAQEEPEPEITGVGDSEELPTATSQAGAAASSGTFGNLPVTVACEADGIQDCGCEEPESTAEDSGWWSSLPGQSTIVNAVGFVPGDVPNVGLFCFMSTYSRFDGSDPLEHDLRVELTEHVKAEPGMTLADLTRSLGPSESTIRYHTRILEEESVLEKRELFGKVRVYPVESSEREMVLTAISEEESLHSVLHAVALQEPATLSEVAEYVDRAPSTVSYHLTRLAEAEVVEREREGQVVQTSLTPEFKPPLEGIPLEDSAP